jgi:hypothetical protein
MRIDKIVARFKDKSLIKGTTNDFSLYKTYFNLNLPGGEEVKVDIEKLKALFHVKSFTGNKNYRYTYKDNISRHGNKVKIEFIDGEVMIGFTHFPRYYHYGFFVTPADLQGNNKRVFVVTSAIKELSFL